MFVFHRFFNVFSSFFHRFLPGSKYDIVLKQQMFRIKILQNICKIHSMPNFDPLRKYVQKPTQKLSTSLYVLKVGKWHLGYCNSSFLPTSRGFKTFFGQYTHITDYYTRY